MIEGFVHGEFPHRVIDYILDHPDETLSIDDIARGIGADRHSQAVRTKISSTIAASRRSKRRARLMKQIHLQGPGQYRYVPASGARKTNGGDEVVTAKRSAPKHDVSNNVPSIFEKLHVTDDGQVLQRGDDNSFWIAKRLC